MGNLFPISSMYGIFTYIYHTYQPNVGKYTIHGWYGFFCYESKNLDMVLTAILRFGRVLKKNTFQAKSVQVGDSLVVYYVITKKNIKCSNANLVGG